MENDYDKKEEDDDYKSYLIRRGKIKKLASKKKDKDLLICEVEHSGTIYKHKKVSLLGKEILNYNKNSILDKKDISDLAKLNISGVNVITALINDENSINEIKDLLGDKIPKIFARIETSEAFYNFVKIINKCDGIIIDHELISTKIPINDVKIIFYFNL